MKDSIGIIEILEYRSVHQPWFEKFNRDWIEEHFWMEPIDVQALQHPEEYIIRPGGTILMATVAGEIAGTVALRLIEEGVCELTKMAVAPRFRGKKVGQTLATAAIQRAKDMGMKKVILYSNTKLKPAIALYRKLGFQEVPVDAIYERSDIKMELVLS